MAARGHGEDEGHRLTRHRVRLWPPQSSVRGLSKRDPDRRAPEIDVVEVENVQIVEPGAEVAQVAAHAYVIAEEQEDAAAGINAEIVARDIELERVGLRSDEP